MSYSLSMVTACSITSGLSWMLHAPDKSSPPVHPLILSCESNLTAGNPIVSRNLLFASWSNQPNSAMRAPKLSSYLMTDSFNACRVAHMILAFTLNPLASPMDGSCVSANLYRMYAACFASSFVSASLLANSFPSVHVSLHHPVSSTSVGAPRPDMTLHSVCNWSCVNGANTSSSFSFIFIQLISFTS